MTPKEFQAEIDRLAKMATDAGRLVELGFLSFRQHMMKKDATDAQITAMRLAFFCGAQHLFGSIMGILDPGEEPTSKDFARMGLIEKELAEFYQFMKAWQKKGMH